MSDSDDWDDLLGTGAVLKRVLVASDQDEELDMEAPRKFFALIDIQTRCQNKIVPSESHENFLINVDADLFPGAHLVIPLMNINETSLYKFESRFCFGAHGLNPHVPVNEGLECTITLKMRAQYDDFLEHMSIGERLSLAQRKKDRGKFWFERGEYENAVAIYKTLTDLGELDMPLAPAE